MAVTQYIGARYVPLLADPVEWSSTHVYEPLTIVTHNGNSYTSRQYVPEGIDITNETFWAMTGNYNAQVEQYRRDTTGLKTRMDTVEGKMETVESGFAVVEGKVTQVEQNVTAIQGDVTTLQGGLETANGRIDTNAQNIASLEGDVTDLEGEIAALKNASALYADVTELKATNLENGKYALLADGSVWYVGASEEANGINVLQGTNKRVRLVIEKPLKVDYLMLDGASFASAVTKGFTLCNEVVLSDKTYELNAAITVPDNCVLSGLGWQASKIAINTSLSGAALDIKDYAEARGFKITGGGMNTTGIKLSGQMPWIRDIWFDGDGSRAIHRIGGVYVSASSELKAGGGVDRCNIYGNYATAIYIEETNDFYVSNVVAQNPNGANGLYLKNKVQALTMSACDIIEYQFPINTEVGSMTEFRIPEHNFFVNCMFDSGQAAFVTNCKNMEFSNCWFSNGRGFGNEGRGAFVGGCAGVTFNGCTFYKCGGWGCVVADSGNDVAFNACTFAQNSYSVSGLGGLDIHGKSVSVMGCIFSDEIAGSSTSKYGISLGSESRNCIFMGNTLVGLTNPVADNGQYNIGNAVGGVSFNSVR